MMEVKQFEVVECEDLPQPATKRDKNRNKCDVCDYSCYCISDLKRHKLVHSGVKLFKCDVCDYTCKQIYQLKPHKLVHSNDKPYKCNACGFCFKRFDGLTRHKLVHSEVRPFKCYACDCSFKRPSDLKAHQIIHKGVKPYKCDTCEYSCNRLDRLKAHRLSQHREKGAGSTNTGIEKQRQVSLEDILSTQILEIVHTCIDCEYCTISASDLRTHLFQHSDLS